MSWGRLIQIHQHGVTEERVKSANGRRVDTYTLTTGERVTIAQLVTDPRNTHGITDGGFRRRIIDRNQRDPADLFAPREKRSQTRIDRGLPKTLPDRGPISR
jgi:hypothetical protein